MREFDVDRRDLRSAAQGAAGRACRRRSGRNPACMTAIAGYWSFDHRPDAAAQLRADAQVPADLRPAGSGHGERRRDRARPAAVRPVPEDRRRQRVGRRRRRRRPCSSPTPGSIIARSCARRSASQPRRGRGPGRRGDHAARARALGRGGGRPPAGRFRLRLLGFAPPAPAAGPRLPRPAAAPLSPRRRLLRLRLDAQGAPRLARNTARARPGSGGELPRPDPGGRIGDLLRGRREGPRRARSSPSPATGSTPTRWWRPSPASRSG